MFSDRSPASRFHYSPRHPDSARHAGPADPDEVPKDCISPNPDVFSYFMLKAPSERKEHRKFTVDAGLSYALVLLTLAIQGTLLYCVYNKVIGRNAHWVSGIMNTGKDWNIYGGTNAEGCNDGGSLCTLVDGQYSCAPPSVQLVGRWDELDTNKDGIWTQAEVKQSRDAIKCKYAVDPVEFFGVLIRLLNERKEHIWLHPKIRSGEGIHKSYFTYIMGDVAMCGYRNEDMCGNLLKRGVFDMPLQNATVPRVGSTITSARDYCLGLLGQGGLCERILPSTYATWKIESVQECQEPKYSKFVKTDPSDGTIKSMLEVDYEARQSYATCKTFVFRAYKYWITLIWALLIASRIREVVKCVAWTYQLPSAGDQTQEALDNEAGSHEIRFMSDRHRIALFVVVTFRMIMLLILLYVGLQFLGRQTQYIDLLLDGVALMFIVEVAEILYERVLRQEVRTSWELGESMELDRFRPLGKWGESMGMKFAPRPDIEDVVFLTGIGLLTLAFIIYYNITMVEPLYEALNCACLSQGDTCKESHTFSKSFWDQYWSQDVPSSIQAISTMKALNAEQHVASPPAVLISSVGRHAVNLLKSGASRQHHLHQLDQSLSHLLKPGQFDHP